MDETDESTEVRYRDLARKLREFAEDVRGKEERELIIAAAKELERPRRRSQEACPD